MKYVPRMPIPWDMVVFLTITTAGFGFSVHRLVTQDDAGLSAQSPSGPLAAFTPGLARSHATDLGCVEKSLPRQRLAAERGSIRLSGRFCHLTKRAMQSFEGVRVRNRTNGHECTVFLRPENPGFTTDVVHLNPGLNEIEVEWRERAGAEPRRVLAVVMDPQ